MKKHYIVVDMSDDMQMPSIHNSIDGARACCQEIIDRESEGLISELYDEFGAGLVIAEIVEVSRIHVNERREDYEARGEEWPYDDEWAWKGEIRMTPLKVEFPNETFPQDDRGNVKP